MTILKKTLLLLLILVMSGGLFYVGYLQGSKRAVFEARKNPPKIEIINQTQSAGNYNFGLFWEVWDMVSKDYLFRPVDPQRMMEGAITGVKAYFDTPAAVETSESSQSSPSGDQ
jgi:hypothetical protein